MGSPTPAIFPSVPCASRQRFLSFTCFNLAGLGSQFVGLYDDSVRGFALECVRLRLKRSRRLIEGNRLVVSGTLYPASQIVWTIYDGYECSGNVAQQINSTLATCSCTPVVVSVIGSDCLSARCRYYVTHPTPPPQHSL